MGIAGRAEPAILQCAFQGKLVPQDPTDEPASALLERIRAEREQTRGNGSRELRTRPPFKLLPDYQPPPIPEGTHWPSLLARDGGPVKGTTRTR